MFRLRLDPAFLPPSSSERSILRRKVTRSYVDERSAFWYYALLTLSISDGYVVECLPSIKAFYVAAAISVPLSIVARSFPTSRGSTSWL